MDLILILASEVLLFLHSQLLFPATLPFPDSLLPDPFLPGLLLLHTLLPLHFFLLKMADLIGQVKTDG